MFISFVPQEHENWQMPQILLNHTYVPLNKCVCMSASCIRTIHIEVKAAQLLKDKCSFSLDKSHLCGE